MKKKLLYMIAAAGLIVGGALSGTLLSAGAATKSNTSTTKSAGAFKSNEDAAHEKGESAAREKAEDSGQMPADGRDGHDGDADGHFQPNTDPAHEKAESAAREAQEQQWKSQGGSSPTPEAGSSSSSQQ